MSPLVYLVMFGWIPFVLYLFRWVPTQRAVIVSFIVAWLFLPEVKFEIAGLPDYTKMSATCYGIILATIVFDIKRFSSFRLCWLDLPMLIWCLCPIPSSLTNDLGLYDGISAALQQTVTWGLPYYLGRLYLHNLDGLRKLAIDIFIGGLIYIPLCLFEVRMSPQLHRILYGLHPHKDFAQTMRYGGFRPTVFMEHGLMVGAWMMAATLIGFWLWKTGIVKQLWGIPVRRLLIALLLTTVLLKATGALALLVVGVAILFVAKRFHTPMLVLVLIVAICSHLSLGVTGTFPKDSIVAVVSTTFDTQRAQSLEFRFNNEQILSARAQERMVFGWGGWGRSRVYDQWGKDISITDSMWIIAFGTNGLVGLLSLTASLLLPVIGFIQSYPARLWNHPQVAPAAAIAVLLVLYMVDCLLNAMINPIYILACGGIAGLVLEPKRTSTPLKIPEDRNIYTL